MGEINGFVSTFSYFAYNICSAIKCTAKSIIFPSGKTLINKCGSFLEGLIRSLKNHVPPFAKNVLSSSF